jgi:hypothetical protein
VTWEQTSLLGPTVEWAEQVGKQDGCSEVTGPDFASGGSFLQSCWACVVPVVVGELHVFVVLCCWLVLVGAGTGQQT